MQDQIRYNLAIAAIDTHGWNYGIGFSNGYSLQRALALGGAMTTEDRVRVCTRILVACGVERFGKPWQQMDRWERKVCKNTSTVLKALKLAEKLCEVEDV